MNEYIVICIDGLVIYKQAINASSACRLVSEDGLKPIIVRQLD